ncbi:MAG: hypothetical protein Q8890_02605, partial [Sweet potato little leaf phytoplasma]|nr:hypothetical protein [Sweet potato little leaf phytoplasma]
MGARKRNEKGMKEKLVQEIIAAASGTGLAVKKRDEIHHLRDSTTSWYSSSSQPRGQCNFHYVAPLCSFPIVQFPVSWPIMAHRASM